VRYTREQPAAAPPSAQASTSSQTRQTQQPHQRRNVRKGTQQHLEQVVASLIGTPYKFGGMTVSGFDCSGFVIAVYREVYEDVRLPRTSANMWKAGRPVSLSAARPGDLVFFKGGAFGAIDHVGIYMGDNRFAHSSSSSGVIYSNLSETYYSRRFAGVRRMM
jgi:cell wall-associated NlpC family hydrolase